MPLTEWDSRYELGVHGIDNHHRKLVELLNKAYDSILYSTDNKELQAILAELIKYADYHFCTEEQMMKEARFKGLKSHVSNHDTFRTQLAALKQNYHSGAQRVNTDIVLFLWNWLEKHILRDDKVLAASLAQK